MNTVLKLYFKTIILLKIECVFLKAVKCLFEYDVENKLQKLIKLFTSVKVKSVYKSINIYLHIFWQKKIIQYMNKLCYLQLFEVQTFSDF